MFVELGFDYLVRRPLFGLLYQLWLMDDVCGLVGGMLGKENLPQCHFTIINPS
jgi:hypothetical protein